MKDKHQGFEARVFSRHGGLLPGTVVYMKPIEWLFGRPVLFAIVDRTTGVRGIEVGANDFANDFRRIGGDVKVKPPPVRLGPEHTVVFTGDAPTAEVMALLNALHLTKEFLWKHCQDDGNARDLEAAINQAMNPFMGPPFAGQPT